VDWERQWIRAGKLRAELGATRALLVESARTLGEVAGAGSLLLTEGAGEAGEQDGVLPTSRVERVRRFRVPLSRVRWIEASSLIIVRVLGRLLAVVDQTVKPTAVSFWLQSPPQKRTHREARAD
jgi:hypothetical protein